MAWQLQEAKQRFSELVRKAESEGPQVVTRNGREVVVGRPLNQRARPWRDSAGRRTATRTDPQSAARLDHWLDGLERQYLRRILPVTEQIAQQWGRMNAVVHGLILVTRNEGTSRALVHEP